MTTKKSIFEFYSDRGIFLPIYHLTILEEEVKLRINKKESIFSITYDLEKRTEYNEYRDPAKGAYVIERTRDASRKSIVAIDDNGNRTHYDSLYQASVAIGKGKAGCSNISKALKGKKTKVYGYEWHLA